VVKRRKIQIFEQMFSSDPIRGHLAKDRLRSLLEQMRIMDPAVHEFLWRQYDIDYNGKIDFQEFWYAHC
jgi:Ca2+-binding EF-hand superfamily protein